ncbi:MAG: hypothetical protein R6U37_01895 [Dehalococcoidia bacterium]
MKRLVAVIFVFSLLIISCAAEDEEACPDASEIEAEMKAKIAELEETIEAEKHNYEAEIENLGKTISSLEWKLEQAIKPTAEPSPAPSPSPSPSIEPTPSPTPTPQATVTPSPSPSPSPSPEPTPTPVISGSPFAQALSSALSYREGPSTRHEVIGQFDSQDDLYLLGQFNNCSWLKVSTTDEKTGWILSQNALIRYLTPVGQCENIPSGTFRQFTKIIESDIQEGGSGKFSVVNNLETDVLIVLKDSRSSEQMAAYIRSGDSIDEYRIEDGDYDFYFTTGIEWGDKAKEFNEQAEYKRFWYLPSFTTTSSTYTDVDITLEPGPAGEIPGSTISPAQFPSVGS